ncbi:MAG: hypothetical protein ACRC1H_09680 [Caldilineaceae bacterium]
MATSKWIASTRGSNPVSVLTTELNSLANDAAVTSAAISNTTEDDQYADLELVVTYGVAPVADKTVDVYLVRQIDGTNYEDGSASRPPAGGFIGSFVLDAVTSAQRKVLAGVMLPPLTFKLLIVNKAGQAMAASGNTLKAFIYNQAVV